MIRDKRKIFGQMFVDIVKYLMTVIVIGSIFAENINFKASIIGIIMAILIGIMAFFVMPNDEEDK
jgi:hypothetical protein